ncbi:MAG TPA: DinB family protein [Ktedonobacteraceae bacterium]
MPEEKKDSRAEEIARVRSYLASQAMKRTPAQLVETLREAHRQFLAAVAAVSDTLFRVAPGDEEWSAADVLGHMLVIAAIDESAIPGVIECGEQPPDIVDLISPAPADLTREQMLAELERLRERLIASVLEADPSAHLDILWRHNEFGQMNWREWLLFARVHTLDHTRQMQSIAQILTSR